MSNTATKERGDVFLMNRHKYTGKLEKYVDKMHECTTKGIFCAK